MAHIRNINADSEVLTVFIREGITINDIEYPPMTLQESIDLWDSLCKDCKQLLRSAVAKGLYNDFYWSTMYLQYYQLTGEYPKGTRCKHCKDTIKTGIGGLHYAKRAPECEEDTGGYRGDAGNDLYANLPSPAGRFKE